MLVHGLERPAPDPEPRRRAADEERDAPGVDRVAEPVGDGHARRERDQQVHGDDERQREADEEEGRRREQAEAEARRAGEERDRRREDAAEDEHGRAIMQERRRGAVSFASSRPQPEFAAERAESCARAERSVAAAGAVAHLIAHRPTGDRLLAAPHPHDERDDRQRDDRDDQDDPEPHGAIVCGRRVHRNLHLIRRAAPCRSRGERDEAAAQLSRDRRRRPRRERRHARPQDRSLVERALRSRGGRRSVAASP